MSTNSQKRRNARKVYFQERTAAFGGAKDIALIGLQNIVAHWISYSQNLQVLTGNSEMNFISSTTPQAGNMLRRQD
jgi:hypothetical protein